MGRRYAVAGGEERRRRRRLGGIVRKALRREGLLQPEGVCQVLESPS